MQSTQDPTCTVQGCASKPRGRGLCEKHYTRMRRTGSTELAPRVVERCNEDGCGDVVAARGLCARHYYAADYRMNPEKYRESARRWRDANREKVREADRARRAAMSPELKLANYRDWRAAHPEVARAMNARRRCRVAGVECLTVTERDVIRLLDRHRGRCSYCGVQLPPDFHLDHIVPLIRGGHHAIGNLAPSCGVCNRSKGKLTVTEWRLRQRA